MQKEDAEVGASRFGLPNVADCTHPHEVGRVGLVTAERDDREPAVAARTVVTPCKGEGASSQNSCAS